MYKKKIIANINITPFVDIMLVLLVIFVALATTMNENIVIDIPKASIVENSSLANSVMITITKTGEVLFEGEKTNITDIILTMKRTNTAEKNIIIRADKNTEYEYIIQALNSLKNAGFSKVALAVDTNV